MNDLPSTADLLDVALYAVRHPHAFGHRCDDGRWYNQHAGTRTPCPVIGHLDTVATQLARLRAQVHTAAHDDVACRVVAEGFTGLSLPALSADDAVSYHHAARLALEALAAHLDPAPQVREFRVTFGQKYAREPHPALPEAHPDGWLTVMAPDEDTARALTVAALGQQWSNLYDPTNPAQMTPDEWADYHPRGSLATIPASSWSTQ